jgi:hypothetical protein
LASDLARIVIQADKLYLPPTKSTPEVNFELGNLQIVGESFPEDAPGYFRPIIDWLNEYAHSEYIADLHNQTIFMSNIEYFNTGSRPFVIEMVKILNDLYQQGHKIHFKWFYDGEIGIEEDDIHFEDLIENFVLPVDYIPRLTK